MRGKDDQQLDVFSYVSPEQRVAQDHPLRSLRAMTDEALRDLQPRFNKLYAKTGRPSIAPEKLLRALLLQALYSVRSERMLMEQLDYNLLFRWFVGLNMDDAIWDVTVFTKNRERLLDGDIAEAFFQAVLQQARGFIFGLTKSFKVQAVQPFPLQGSEQRLATRVIPAVAFATHRSLNSAPSE